MQKCGNFPEVRILPAQNRFCSFLPACVNPLLQGGPLCQSAGFFGSIPSMTDFGSWNRPFRTMCFSAKRYLSSIMLFVNIELWSTLMSFRECMPKKACQAQRNLSTIASGLAAGSFSYFSCCPSQDVWQLFQTNLQQSLLPSMHANPKLDNFWRVLRKSDSASPLK